MNQTAKTEIFSIGEVLYDVYPDRSVIGGAPFNFIYHIRKLTGQGRLISQIGNDRPGKDLARFLSDNSMSDHFIATDERHPTGTAQVAFEKDKTPVFTIPEEAAYDYIEITDAVETCVISNAYLLYFGTLAQRNPVTRKSIERLYALRVKLLFDVNLRQNYYSEEILSRSLSAAHIVKMNLDELRVINDLFFHIPFDLYELAADIVRVFRSELVCVTMGSEGAVLTDGNYFTSYRHPLTDITDTVGAGDGMAAILALGYQRHWDLQTLIERASEFAADVCRYQGALLPDTAYTKFRGWFEPI